MTPIEKNVIVVDEQGNEYEATYPKRARGLVKNGRARFIEENKICLACPPTNDKLEDNKMSTYNVNNITKREIWEQIKKLQDLLENIDRALNALQCVQSHVIAEEDQQMVFDADVAMTKAQAIQKITAERETTIREMLKSYFALYNKADEVPEEDPAE